MSDALQQAGHKPALATPQTVKDSLGRTLTLQRLDLLAELDLLEAAGSNAENRRWMMIATLSACVTSINGVPTPISKNRDHIREQVRRVGVEGLAAVTETLTSAEQEVVRSADEEATVAKN